MLTLEERNAPALDAITSIIDKLYHEDEEHGHCIPTLEMIKQALQRVFSVNSKRCGEQWVSWKKGPLQRTVSWVIQDGRIIQIFMQTVENGAVTTCVKEKLTMRT